PGMKWSTVLVVASIGMRLTADQLVPVLLSECVITRSLRRHEVRKRQSDQTTYTVPALSISAEGKGPSRRLPATVWCEIVVIVVMALQVLPPSVECKAPMAV